MEKKFILHCKCGWKELSTGLTSDLTHLQEVKSGCKSCGKLYRLFVCPNCNGKAKLTRIKCK